MGGLIKPSVPEHIILIDEGVQNVGVQVVLFCLPLPRP